MQVSPIGHQPLHFQRFFKHKSAKDDVKVYKREGIKEYIKQQPDFSYSPDIPIRIRKRKSVQLQEGQVLDCEKNAIFNRHTTAFFRPDLDWGDFGRYLKEKFSNTDKVNTYVWGCSYGEEAYSMSILLSRYFDDKEKFFPIHAIDIDSDTIEKAQTERKEGIELNLWELGVAMDGMKMKKEDAEKFLSKCKNKECYTLKDDFANPIEFSVGNIITDTDKIDDKNPSIILCRNMWPYVCPSKYNECAKKMYDRLAKGSIVVIGSYDYRGDDKYFRSDMFPKALEKAGFKSIIRDNPNNKYYMNDFLIFEKE